MKTKVYIITFLSFISFGLLGQTTLLSESFETDGNGFRYVSNQSGSCNDFFDRLNGTPTCFSNTISGVDGSWFMAAEDVNDRPNGGDAMVTMNAVNASNYVNLMVSVNIATSDAPTASWEVDDHVFIEYAFDGDIGINWSVAGLFQGNPPVGNNSGFLTVDTDNNPNTAGPYGAQVSATGALSTFTFNIPATGNNLSVRVRVSQDGGSEEVAFDLIEIKGTLSVNNPPVLDNIESLAIDYTEGDPATQVSNTITVADSEGDNITSATVEIFQGFESGADVLSFTPQFGITGSQTGSTLNLSGSASTAQYQTVLRSVKYQNTNTTNPSILTRTVNFRVSDGNNSNIIGRDINFTQTLNGSVTLPACEGFETDGHGTRYYAYEYALGNDFWERHDASTGAHPSHGQAITGYTGNWIWVGEDVVSNNPNPANIGEMLLNPFVATALDSFTVSVDLGVSDIAPDSWEAPDYCLIQYSIDGGSWETIGAFYGNSSTNKFQEDADLDGTADPAGAILTNALSSFTYGFPATGTALEVRLLHRSNGSEEFAFDNICVVGYTTLPPPPPPCSITSLAPGAQSACNNNLYTQEVIVTYSSAPGSGTLDVNGQSFAITGSPQTVTLTGLAADGNPVNVTAEFSADQACTLTQNALFSAPNPCPPPVNDKCFNALPLACGDTIYGSNVYSTTDTVACGTTDGVWYEIIGTGGSITVATCGLSSFDTYLLVSNSATCSSNLTCDYLNDDYCGLQSSITFPTTAGSVYKILVFGFGSAKGNFGLYANCDCSISSITTGTQSPCVNNAYSQDVIVTYAAAPSSGTLDVNGQSFAITSSPQTVTLAGLVADGNPVNVTALFSADNSCTKTENALFTAPAPCQTTCTNPVSINITPYNNAYFLPQLDPYTFYFGTTQWKRISMNHSGGVGPFTYSWGKIGTGQLKNQSANGKGIYLFEPFGPTKVFVTVSDLGTGCDWTDTLHIGWDDQYFCGTITPRSYKLVVCENGVTKCVSWRTAKTLITGGLATLGPCNQQPLKTNITGVVAKLYPNPTKGEATLEYYGAQSSSGRLTVMDINGRVLHRAQLNVNSGVQYQNIDLSDFPNGMYIVRLSTDHDVFTEKLQLIK